MAAETDFPDAPDSMPREGVPEVFDSLIHDGSMPVTVAMTIALGVFGDGGHRGAHGGSIFPDTLRWVWRK